MKIFNNNMEILRLFLKNKKIAILIACIIQLTKMLLDYKMHKILIKSNTIKITKIIIQYFNF